MAGPGRAAAVALVLVIALGMATVAADAKTKHHGKRGWHTSSSLSQNSSTRFTGKVSSKLGKCIAKRVVTLYYTDPSTLQTQPLSVHRTGGKGKFQIDLVKPAFTGSYYAAVAQRKVRAHGAKQTCKAGQSRTLAVQGQPLAPG
ncbi:MAG: hypothetical protein ACHQCI_08070 [Solirubrobacterales bacterium]